jgi:hypothetical protein
MRISCFKSLFIASPSTFSQAPRCFGLATAALAVVGMIGCGGSVPSLKTTQPGGDTQVTVLLSGAANDKLTQYQLTFTKLTLTNQSGTVVTLFTSQPSIPGINGPEFVHLNGNSFTLGTASVPDDTYTSATLTVGSSAFTCIAVNPQNQSLTTSEYVYQNVAPQTTVTLPQPIVVSGDTMNLMMTLDMAQSYSLDQCIDSGLSDAYAITPNFSLATANLASPATNYLNGKELDVQGEVSSVTSSGFTVTEGYARATSTPLPTQAVTVNGSTVYQGISGLTTLAAGNFVSMDLAAQPDGSLLATRVAVADPTAVDAMEGPLLFISNAIPALTFNGGQRQGTDQIGGTMTYDISQASFHISGAFMNLASLPFTPSFTAASLVPGQNIYMTTPAYSESGVERYPLAGTITLMQQTVDGTVTNVESSGSFNTYTIALASYDLFVNMAGQPGAMNLIEQPSQIVVYADSSASLAGVAEPTVGTTYRFHGLVFNDGGVLRMDCDQIAAGVAQ